MRIERSRNGLRRDKPCGASPPHSTLGGRTLRRPTCQLFAREDGENPSPPRDCKADANHASSRSPRGPLPGLPGGKVRQQGLPPSQETGRVGRPDPPEASGPKPPDRDGAHLFSPAREGEE